MTDPKTPHDRRSEDLERLVGEALAGRGELPPTTEAEVERAEASGIEDELELPESLREYQPPSAPAPRSHTVVSLADARRARSRTVLTHAVALAIGAAAAAFAFTLRDRPSTIGGTPTGEPPFAPRDAAPASSAPTTIGPVRACHSPCCAGSSCKSAKSELASCPSGRTCIGCTLDQLGTERYRLTLSSFAPGPAARKLLERRPAPPLELCVQVGSSELECVPAHSVSATDPWTRLSLSVSAQDLVHGFLFQVRTPGAPKPLAEWRNPVRLDPNLLCKGLFIRAKTDSDEAFGTISVFLQDTYFVELARSDTITDLDKIAARFAFDDVRPQIFPTSKSGHDTFALAIGPLPKQSAERLRTDLLRAKQEATLTIGEDHDAEPLKEP